MPGTAFFGHQLVEGSIPADQVMGADFAAGIGQRPERLFDIVIACVMKDDVVRPTFVVVGGGDGNCLIGHCDRNAAACNQEDAQKAGQQRG